MESTIVIKVKYGETLRRFNARLVDEELDLDMDGLKEKIVRLFNFAPNADLVITYIDEDGDVVTLVDDEDLRDVIRQSLNPLRISVRLNTEKGARSYARSSGSCTPMRSPRVQHPLQNLNTSVSEILKSVPEPVREALSKLPFDLASKATSSAPELADLIDCFSKMGLAYMNRVSEFRAGEESSIRTGASLGTIGVSVTKDQNDSKVGGATSEMLENAKSEAPTVKDNEVLPNAENEEQVDLGNMNSRVEASVMPAPCSVNIPTDNILFVSAPANTVPGEVRVAVDDNEVVNKFGERHLSEKSDGFVYMTVAPVSTNFPAEQNREVKKSSECLGPKSSGIGASASNIDNMKAHFYPNPINECPFSGMPVANDSSVPPQYYSPHGVPFKRSYNHSDGIGSVFHRGVRCDGCGVHPITGPRFKSKVKEDYDLCSICFSEMGNVADYIRMDRPVNYRQPLSFKGLYDTMHHSRGHPPLPQVSRGSGKKPSRPKLDSRFIKDVNVLDGTIIASSTPFTKIWRMKNNGTIVWPHGTQLLWIGGDRLSNTPSVEIEIPADGLPVDNELDIAVDFTAPEHPGRYISYWRMALPSGQKFGQRVWVLIQVDASMKEDSWCQSIHGLNLNLPPVSSGIEIVNVNAKPMVDSLAEPDNSNKVTELVEPIVYARPNKDQELNFPINDTLLVGRGVSSPVPPKAASSGLYPIIDLSEVAPIVPSPAPSSTIEASLPAQEASGNGDVEQTLLRELEEMGFKQVDLNKEILRINEYNLEQSVDDLCDVAEWDPILAELQEMGFCDEEVNKRLLKKNNGSIKRVVMDLIAGEKA